VLPVKNDKGREKTIGRNDESQSKFNENISFAVSEHKADNNICYTHPCEVWRSLT